MATFGLFPASNPRIRWLRAVLVGAMLSGMLCCLPLWLSSREYPLVPLLPHWLILRSVCGPYLLGLTLASLVASAWCFRPAIFFFLAATLYLFGCDQNREQPWFYIYWVMLLLNFLPEPTALAACRLAFSVVYFWAGIQKLNSAFFNQVPAWFVQPAENWGWPGSIIDLMHDCVLLTPFLEVFIALGLWFKKTRWLAIGVAVILHGAALLFLGPIGRDVNRVIWPWNLAMMALLAVLFAAKESISSAETWRELRRSLGGAVIISLYACLPVLSFFGLWDSYLSFALYSYNLADADVYVSQSLLSHLPPKLQTYVYPVKHFNPMLQLPYMLEYRIWAQAEMGVPPLPEPRGYRLMFQHIEAYATNDDNCRMLLETRDGRILLYRLNATKPDILK